jgi:hypothetical protein
VSSITTEIVIDRIKNIHGERYDCSKVVYVNGKTKIEVICHTHGSFKVRPDVMFRGGGCQKCSNDHMSELYTKSTEQFISESTLKYGDIFDYSLVDYKNASTKIKLICKKHNLIFRCCPSDHLKKISRGGCRTCDSENKSIQYSLTTKEFIKMAKSKFGDEFDYSLVDYKNATTKIKIICKNGHGIFEKLPGSHLVSKGCPRCIDDNISKLFTKTKEQFIIDSKKIHGNDYNYDQVSYNGCNDHVKIFCKKCNKYFLQTPTSHLNEKHGCQSCARNCFDPTKPATLYYVKIEDEYKIGITNLNVEKRFRKIWPYVKIIKTWHYDKGSDAHDEEQRIIKKYKKYKFHGINSKYGTKSKEMFIIDVLGLDEVRTGGKDDIEFNI